MARLALKDRAQDRLGAALAIGATSLVLDDVTEFKSTKLTPPFLIIVDSGNTKEEIMLVTVVTELTKTLTVVRDIFGTTDVAHAKGALVVHTGTPIVMTARIDAIQTETDLYLMPPKCVVVEVLSVVTDEVTGTSTLTLKNKTDTMGTNVVTGVAGTIVSTHPILYNEFDGVADYLHIANDAAATGGGIVVVTVIAMME